MTVREEIKRLEELKQTTEINLHCEGMHDYKEALDKAIRSLRAWEKVDKEMQKLIDMYSDETNKIDPGIRMGILLSATAMVKHMEEVES